MRLLESLILDEPEFNVQFTELNQLRDKVKPAKHCEYRYLSSTQLTFIQNKFKGYVTKSPNSVEAAYAIRATTYYTSSVSGVLKRYKWVKRNSIHLLTDSIIRSIEADNLLSALILARSLLEHIGNFCLLYYIDVEGFLKANNQGENHDALIDFHGKLVVRGMGTRFDWKAIFSKGLTEGKKKSYTHEKGTLDLTAQGLLDGVDQLDKEIKGARKLYEFLCEFAHPNIGVQNLFLQNAIQSKTHDGIRSWKYIYGNDFPSEGLKELSPILLDTFQILNKSIKHYLQLEDKLLPIQKKIDRMRLKFIDLSISVSPTNIYHKNDPCPCFSGLPIVACCGKKYRNRLFTN